MPVCGDPMPMGRTAACSSRCRAERSRRVAVVREGLLNLAYGRDEEGEAMYRGVKAKIKAASTAGVRARKLVAGRERAE